MTKLFDAADIRLQTQILAKKISDEHRGDGSPVVMIGLRDRDWETNNFVIVCIFF